MDLLFSDVPTEQQLVTRQRVTVRTALRPEQPDIRGVVLAARVGAARDIDPDAADLGETFFLKPFADRLGETPRLCDSDVARVGTRARNDVAGQLRARSGHIDGHEGVVQRAPLRFGESAEHDVLTVG
ncbi:unannotated protein [freshwater metagenome]|uniref:Unannotated protein n=1 Tax=freshwater metagenome TaxID=449393 RepID=A0A6J7E617_9ZZZZ